MTQIVLDGLISIVCISIIAQYSWSAKHHFEVGKMGTQVRLLIALVASTSLIFMYFTWHNHQPLPVQILALLALAVSDLLFWWAVRSSRQASLRYIFNKDEQRPVIRTGVYAHIRHPFYASYILFWSAWALAVWHPLAAVPVLAFATVFFRAARGEEQAFAQSKFADDYAQYKREAGLFWPNLLKGSR